jgi:1-acyl-sn-glycerol-3-phosphate acyltransferase
MRLLMFVIFGTFPVQRLRAKQCIIVSNHNSHLDIAMLYRLFPISQIKQLKVVAAKDYFEKGPLSVFARYFFNIILIERKGSDGSDPLFPIKQALGDGYAVIIFPEGTRGQPGVMKRFKTGVARAAIDFPDIPVYPVVLSGTEKSLPRKSGLPVPFNLNIKVHDPFYGRDYADIAENQGFKKLTEDLENIIRRDITSQGAET